ncbi:MAG: 30S ribosomal protein S17 [Endomicrobium sp.]|jgi:small subunit ribosomal protein S17|nr:30S ribosomal protein S17 [Endomicrobium sp.]
MKGNLNETKKIIGNGKSIMSERNKRKRRIGVVVNDKNEKTRKVSVKRTYRHPLYGRVIRSKSKIAVHDEKNMSRVGDMVEIIESRPLSKTKRWVLIKILSRNINVESIKQSL